eukprot:Rhum_TRINITY_DN14424_c13_g1::Rhum_TRINITY_DN14424_c13_g1_i1::g.89160::m.89160
MRFLHCRRRRRRRLQRRCPRRRRRRLQLRRRCHRCSAAAAASTADAGLGVQVVHTRIGGARGGRNGAAGAAYAASSTGAVKASNLRKPPALRHRPRRRHPVRREAGTESRAEDLANGRRCMLDILQVRPREVHVQVRRFPQAQQHVQRLAAPPQQRPASGGGRRVALDDADDAADADAAGDAAVRAREQHAVRLQHRDAAPPLHQGAAAPRLHLLDRRHKHVVAVRERAAQRLRRRDQAQPRAATRLARLAPRQRGVLCGHLEGCDGREPRGVRRVPPHRRTRRPSSSVAAVASAGRVRVALLASPLLFSARRRRRILRGQDLRRCRCRCRCRSRGVRWGSRGCKHRIDLLHRREPQHRGRLLPRQLAPALAGGVASVFGVTAGLKEADGARGLRHAEGRRKVAVALGQRHQRVDAPQSDIPVEPAVREGRGIAENLDDHCCGRLEEGCWRIPRIAQGSPFCANEVQIL